MFDRWSEEDGLLDALDEAGAGSITFSPLAQGILSTKYFDGIPENSRATRGVFLKKEFITEEKISKAKKLNEMALDRGQSLSQMALAWNLRKNRVTSVLIGAHNPEQIEENVKTVQKLNFTDSELNEIEAILK